MEKLIVLGTGNALATKCYNTCFAIKSGDDILLTDAGGGNGILVQMEKTGVDAGQIHHIIITHEHCDHLLGIVWMIRRIGTLIRGGKYEGTLKIYCHAGLIEPVKAICGYTLQKKFTNLFDGRIIFIPIADNDSMQILNYNVTFFDIHSTKAPQYGFTLKLQNGKILTCMGDEPYNPLCERYISGSDWLLSEAFCLYEDRDRFKPYEKHHSTVKDACELASQLGVGNLVLWHTEDKNYLHRKELYSAEGTKYYHGNLFIPYDLENIDLV
jgi:Metal-dependent hydrolases of the beta-lactamase superfamily III